MTGINSIRTSLQFSLLAVALSAAHGRAEGPNLGDAQTRTVITLSLHVGSIDKEVRRVTYTPPPGWYVRSHRVLCKKRFGNTSYTVTTVPRDWGWTSEEKAQQSSRVRFDAAGHPSPTGPKARVALDQERHSTISQQVHASHHALVVEASVKGEGFLQGGGGLELTVNAELVFIGEAGTP